jgi:hypothetical protein
MKVNIHHHLLQLLHRLLQSFHHHRLLQLQVLHLQDQKLELKL